MADSITVAGIETRCIIGVNPSERWRLQFIRLQLKLELLGVTAAYSGRLADTIDYSQMTALSRFVLSASRFFLIETAVEALCAVILDVSRASPLEAVTVELAKPEALPGAACVTFAARRTGQTLLVAESQEPFGAMRQIFATGSVVIVSLRINPGCAVPAQLLRQPGAACLALSHGIAALPLGQACLACADYEVVNTSQQPCELLMVVPRAGAEQGLAPRSGIIDFITAF